MTTLEEIRECMGRRTRWLRSEARYLAIEAAKEFAALNGWKHEPSYYFSVRQLAKGQRSAGRRRFEDEVYFPDCWGNIFDHLLYFRASHDFRLPMAIIGQPYEFYPDQIAKVEALGLKAHQPRAKYGSFHFPGACFIYAFTRPDTAVKWLPEQDNSEGRFARYVGFVGNRTAASVP